MSDRLRRRLAAARLDHRLPDRLRRRLEAIGDRSEVGAPPTFTPGDEPWPRLALPDALAERLRQIPEGHGRRTNRWLRSPRYVVVASYLLAVASWLAVGDPIPLGAALAQSVSGDLQSAGQLAERHTRNWLDKVGSSTRRALDDGYTTIKGTVGELVLNRRSEPPADDSTDREPGDRP